ncbi:hypothetical protein KJ713_01850 [Patescibacteria group bacterium]|nr:hypothetical protein [Patescibacteria group bacterium]
MTLQEIYNLAVKLGMEADPRDDDIRILYAGTKKELKRIMVGIEIEPAEVVMAKILKNIDAIIAYQIPNPERTADAAKLLDLPLLSIKTPIDNLAQEFIKIAKEKQRIIPEYYELSKNEIKDAAFISLGMNLFLDELEKNKINIVPCSGLIRVKRITH